MEFDHDTYKVIKGIATEHYIFQPVRNSESTLNRDGVERRQGGRENNLLSDGRKLHDMECFVICGSTLIDVHNHGGSALPTEDGLEETGQFALPEGNIAVLHPDRGEERMTTRVYQISAFQSVSFRV